MSSTTPLQNSSTTLHEFGTISADGISLAYRARRVLTDVSLTVPPGARVGLIGENGTGKSTLLRVLAGVEEPDSGRIVRPQRTGLLWQEPPFDAADTVADALDDALADARALEQALEAAALDLADGTAEAARRYDEALAVATRADVWAAQARAETTLAALGLADVGRARPVGELSGGQRARLSLAWLLIRRPTALVLDEPTNHLDDAAVAFLLATLADWPGPVLFASHDRAFLDDAANGVLDLDPAPHEGRDDLDDLGDLEGPIADGADERAPDARGSAGHAPSRAVSGRGLTAYGGSFSEYLVERERRRERWRTRYRAERAELARLEALAEQAQTFGRVSERRADTRIARKYFGDRNARVISQRVRSAQRQADDLMKSAVDPPPEPLAFSPPRGTVPAEDGPVVEIDGAAVDGRLAPVDVALAPSDALLVTGPNGAGKSTLLSVLADRLAVTRGAVEWAPETRIGLLEQDVTFTHAERSASRIYRDAVGAERAEVTPLETFGLFTASDARRPASELSVGQRRRVALAIVLADPPDLLLLDEPSNHLSLALATELETALADFPGALVVASHDRWLRQRWWGGQVELTPWAAAERPSRQVHENG